MLLNPWLRQRSVYINPILGQPLRRISDFTNSRFSNLLPETWVISTKNTESMLAGKSLAEKIGLPTVNKIISPSNLNRYLPFALGNLTSKIFNSTGIDSKVSNFPRFIVASENLVIPACLLLKKISKNQSFLVFNGKPECSLNKFDAVSLSWIEKMELRKLGPFMAARKNVFSSELPISAYSPDVKGKSREASNSTGIPTSQAGKHMAVFIDSCWHPSVYKMSVDDAEKLGKDLEKLAGDYGFSLSVRFSKNTPLHLKKVVMGSLTRIKAQNKGCSIDYWDEEHPNEVTDPYETYLFRADHVLITADALNTLSNSLYLGKPTYIINQESTSKLLRTLYANLNEKNFVRRFYLGGSFDYMLDGSFELKADILSTTSEDKPFSYYLDANTNSALKFSQFIAKKYKSFA